MANLLELKDRLLNYFNPKVSGLQGFWGTPVAKGMANIQSNARGNIKALSNPETAQLWSKGFNTRNPIGYGAKVLTDYYIAPTLQTPYYANQFKQGVKNKNLLQVGTGALGVMGGVLGPIPDPTDLGFMGYQFGKGYMANAQNAMKTKDYKSGAIIPSLKAGLRSLSGETEVGLGEALGQKGKVKDVMNFAELPMVLGAGIVTGRVNAKKTEKMLKANSNTIFEFQNLVKDYPQLRPKAQMEAIERGMDIIKKFEPSVAKSKQFKALLLTQPLKALDFVDKIITDKILSVRGPNYNFGFNVKELKRTQPKGVGDAKTIQKVLDKNSKLFTDILDGKAGVDWKKLTPEEIKIRDAFTDYTMKPEVYAKYKAGAKDTEIIQDFIISSQPQLKGVKVKGNLEDLQGRKSIPQVKLATKPVKLLKVSKPKPQLEGGGLPSGLKPPSSIPTIDPVDKIINALKGAKPIRGQQEAIYSKIRSQQAGALAGIQKQMGGEAGFYKGLGKLKGEMPKVSFESIKSQFKQPELDALFNKINEANMTPFEKVTAQEGLKKLLGSEGGVIPNESELKLLNEIFPPEFTQAVLDNRPLIQKLFKLGEEALNLPRAMMATADLSAPLRQGVFLIGRPKQWLPAFVQQFKYFFSEKAYKGLAENIKARPTYQAMRESKLAITDISPLLQTREEMFMSNLAEKIPGFGKLARASNRAYSGFLNKLRADTFDDLYKTAKNQGLLKENPGLINDIARFVNAATGRGNLGALERAAPVLNGAFFSPRLMASRLNLLNPVFYAKLDPFVRKEALKSLLTFAGTGMTILGLAKLSGAEVGTDPRSSDFGKIKVGNTRLDLWGGFQQYFRAAGQLITGKYVSSTTGKEYTLGEGYKPLTRLGILGRVIESKEAPIVSFVSSLLTGQNSLGGKLDVPVEVLNRFIPMVASGFYDLYKEGGLREMGLGLPSIFGVGVQTYGKQIPTMETTASGKPTIKLNPVGGLPEDIMNKIRGTQPSNIPQNQWEGIVKEKTQETQNKIQKDKLKQQLEAGQVPTNIDTQNPEIEKLLFEYSSEQSKIIGDKYYYKEEGSVKSLPLTPESKIKELELTGNTELDKKLTSKYKSSITSAINGIVSLYEKGVIDEKEAEDRIKKLQTITAKTAKVKKPKKITIKLSKAPKIKTNISKRKMLTIKAPKLAKLKAVKIKLAKQKAIKISTPKIKIGKTSKA